MRSRPEIRSQRSEIRGRRGFTLVEMLVAIMIILILSAMTLALVNVSMDSDRLRSSARQVQSYLAGARDRAIFAGQPRGVRFVLNPDMRLPVDIDGDGNPDDVDGDGQPDERPYTVDSLVFVGDAGLARGTLRILDTGASTGVFLVERVRGTPWSDLFQRALLVPGSRIRIINGSTKVWLDIHLASYSQALAGNNRLRLGRPHPDYLRGTAAGHPQQPNNPDVPAQRDLEYELELAPAVLPNQEPVLLAQGIAIDLELVRLHARGKFPGIWFDSTVGQYSPHIDVMFSPRGTVTGPAAAYGLIRFLLADVGDIERRLGFIDRDLDGNMQIDEHEQSVAGKLLVTVFTRTGQISTHPVDPTDGNGDGFADDPFYFAEHGEVAK
jgi:prepilin-type N-terminal cleavage/methylation domain-containing protein